MVEALRIVLLVLAVALIVLSTAWRFGRSRTIIERWAARSGYVLVSAKRSLVPADLWYGSIQESEDDRVVFRVVVRDSTGHTRSGTVRCGGLFLGLLSDKVEVTWD